MDFAEVAPVIQSTNVPMAANVPIGVFVAIFGVILGVFLIWYMINRRHGE